MKSPGKIAEEEPLHSAHIHRGPTMRQGLAVPRIQIDKAPAVRAPTFREF